MGPFKKRKKSDSDAPENAFDLFRARKFHHIILWFSLAAFIILVVWAYFSVIDEVTNAEGRVVPSTQVQVIQNLEGGIIEKIFVKEGEVVDKDQIILQLDDTRFIASFREGMTKESLLEIQVARLMSEAKDKPFEVREKLRIDMPDFVDSEEMLYESREKEERQIGRALALVKKEFEMTKPLVSEGAASEVEVLRLERQINELTNQLSSLQSRVLNELTEARADLKTTQAANMALLDRLERTTIRSPVKGIVKQIKVNTTGGVVQPGMEIMQIVPLEDKLLIEAQVRPSNIGFIYPGQDVIVKILTYDFAIYGGLEGKVEQISADTIQNDKGEHFYIIRVRTDKNYLVDKQGKKLFIIPGMTAQVNILTGKKSVLDYILKPILKAKSNALRER